MSKRQREGDGGVPQGGQDILLPETHKKSKTNLTLQDKIVAAIRALRSPTGSSAQAIQKMILTFNGSPTAFKKALAKAVEKGVLERNKASYLVIGDPIYEDLSAKVAIEDVIIGEEGEPVSMGSACVISYIGTLQSSGNRFDSSKSFSFTVGEGEVIKGMDQGIRGMKVGGRRRLTIPAALGYGKRGSSPDIPPDATLCFDIKLLKIK